MGGVLYSCGMDVTDEKPSGRLPRVCAKGLLSFAALKKSAQLTWDAPIIGT